MILGLAMPVTPSLTAQFQLTVFTMKRPEQETLPGQRHQPASAAVEAGHKGTGPG